MQLPHASPEQALGYFQNKLAFTAGPKEVERMIDDGDPITIVDVRKPKEYAKGHVPHALSIPKEHWTSPAALESLYRNKLNVVYCYSAVCHLAANFCAELASRGYRVMEMEGGMEAWKQNGLDVEKSSLKQSTNSSAVRN